MAILKVNNLSKKFKNHEVLKNINFVIEESGIYGIIGPNGSGKTTLFNIISNLIKADSGNVEVLGKSNNDSDVFFEVSFLKDNTVLYDYLTGYNHLTFIKTAQKLPKEKVNQVISKLNIESYINKKVANYSLGMKQHLLIAMAIINEPKLMILDEPLNGLDPASVIKVRKLLNDLADKGTVILISSHTLSEMDLLTDKIMFLKDGEIFSERINSNSENIYKITISDICKEKL